MAYVGSTSYLSIRPYGLLAYTHYEYTGSRGNPPDRVREKPQAYTGVLSTFAKKKLKKAISLLVAISKDKEATNFKTGKKFKFKVNFITLTLPAAQGERNDKEIKHCLDNWVKRAKRKHGLKSYVWRAERQKNGNIHFHLISDTYIHYEAIRNDWNEVLSPTGLVLEYQRKNGNKIPNSTDVHSVQQIKNLTQYFIKYMSKSHKEGEKPIQGKVWDCSANLKSKDSCTIHMDAVTSEQWELCWNSGYFETLSTDTCAIIFLKEDDWVHLKGTRWEREWLEYLDRVRAAA